MEGEASKWYNPAIKKYEYDLERSRALLVEAGFTFKDSKLLDEKGNVVSFTIFSNKGNNTREQMGLIVVEDLKKLGMAVDFRLIDFNALVQKISDTYDYDCIMLGLTSGAPDPASGLSVYMSNGRMHQWYPRQPKPATPWEAEIDVLMQSQLKTLDETKRKQMFDRVQLIMTEQMPYIYLVTPRTYVAYRSKIKNIDFPPQGSEQWNFDSWYMEDVQ